LNKKPLFFLLLCMAGMALPLTALAGTSTSDLRTAILNLEEHLHRAQAAQGPLCAPEVLALAQTCLASSREEFQEGDYWEAEDILAQCQKQSEGIWERILACGKDQDVDGVPDLKDVCPEAPETYNGYRDRDGCPDKMPERALLSVERIEIADPVQFDEATQNLLPSADLVLRDVARILRENPGIRIQIQAHVDDSVPPQRAQEITNLRAEKVKNKLLELGVAPVRINAAGKGCLEPVASNDSPMGRLVNQRVEFVRIP
jgi:outer membrane protein OmpA-like peptidoglycan-associated protein